MTSPKHRRKARRRAEKLMDEAWEAVLRDELALAEKLGRRAVEAGPMNPRLWLDCGEILRRRGNDDEAEAAFRHAIALAPTFADAFTALAALQADRGKPVQAARLQQRAVELAPDDGAARALLDRHRAAIARVEEGATEEAATPRVAFTSRTERHDWEAVAEDLRRAGAALLRGLLSAAECDALAALWEDGGRFEHEEVRDGEAEGRFARRYLTGPLPAPLGALSAELYARAAAIANGWGELLGRRERFPLELERLLSRCRDAGQHRSSTALARYPEGGFEPPRRVAGERVAFPLRLAVCLGGREGLELLLADQRPGREPRPKHIAVAAGDGVLLCARERLVEIAGALGLQPVLHGVAAAPGARCALSVAFHLHG